VKCVSEYLLGVIVGGVIGFLSAFLSTFLTDFLRAKRELKKWELESTHDYFRRLYDTLAPFFIAPYKIAIGLLGYSAYQIMDLTKEEQQQISFNLDNILREIEEALKNFIDKGYIGLFPKDLGGMLLTFTLQIGHSNTLIKEKGVTTKETIEHLKETMSMGDKIRNRMRQLLNVDALD